MEVLKTVLHCLSNAGTFGIAQSEDFGLITFSSTVVAKTQQAPPILDKLT